MYPDMSYPATVSAFVLDKYEVTVGRFRKFVEAGGGTQAGPPMTGAAARTLNDLANQGGWDPSWNSNLSTDTATLETNVKCNSTYQTWTDATSTDDNLPMNCITWYEAFAFCAWDGGYLPSESEWNYAAAGGAEQRAYPWSSPAGSTTIDCSYANYDIGVPSGAYCTGGTTGAVNRVGNESPRGDGKWGQSDLAGNVWEWILDWYASPYENLCNDCANLTTASYRVIRGGDFFFGASDLRGAFRNDVTPYDRYADNGVRCGRAMTR
jgi:formylglycine-generating enzyme required for sulfatase activity